LSVELLNQLKKLTAKYQVPFGIAVFGFTAPSSAKEILVDSDGHLQVDVLAGTITATVDKVKVWDGADYLEMDASGRIGISNFPADYPDSAAQTKLDSILTELQQKLETADLSIEAVTKYLQTKVTNFPTDYPDSGSQTKLDSILTELQQKLETADLLFDASKRLKVTGDTAAPVPVSDAGGSITVDAVDLDIRDLTATERTVLGSQGLSFRQKATTGELQIDDGGNVISVDDAAGSLTVDAVDLDIRDLTTTERTPLGSQAQSLLQRATTYDLLVQLRNAGSEIDPRQIRALTSSDVVSAVQSGTWSTGRTWNLGKATDGVSAKIDENVLGFQFLVAEPTALIADTANLYARVDAYKRLLVAAVQSGTWNVNALTSITNPVTVQATDLDIRNLTKTLDEIYGVLRTDAGVAYDSRDRNWALSATERTPLGSQGQSLQQKATTYELQVDLKALTYGTLPVSDAGGSLTVDAVDLDIRDLTATERTPLGSQAQSLLQRATTYDLLVQLRNAGSEIDPRSIRALTSSDVVSAVQSGTWSVGRTWNLSASDVPDLSDRAARLVGRVYGSQGQPISQKATTYETLTDPVDRAARLLGVVYGSQGQSLQQKATTYELQVDLKALTYGTLPIHEQTAWNPPNLDAALSTRLADATFTGRFPAAAALSDTLGNPTTTQIGAALLGYYSAGAVWQRVYTDGSNRLKAQLDAIPNPSNLDVALSTRALESGGNLAAIAAKDFATQTTLNALNTKIPADPSREGGNLATVASRLDVALSTRALESGGNLAAIASKNFIEKATTPAIYNVTCTTANTEYSQALPANARKFLIKPRGTGDLKVCFTSGASGTTYATVKSGASYYEDLIQPSALTFYFQSPTAGEVAEIVAWS